ADLQDLLPDDRGDVRVRLGGHLAGDVHLTGGDQGLDRHPAAAVLADERVEDGVADRVGDLVGGALRDRLGGEQTPGHGTPDCANGMVTVEFTGTAADRRSPAVGSAQVSRAATWSQSTAARPVFGPYGTAISPPSAASTTASFSVVSNARPSPTALTTS